MIFNWDFLRNYYFNLVRCDSDHKDWHSLRVGCSEGAVSWEGWQGKAVSKGKEGSTFRAETGWGDGTFRAGLRSTNLLKPVSMIVLVEPWSIVIIMQQALFQGLG